MNILIDKLPTKIKVNENIYNINYDYKTIIKILMAFEDNELTHNEQLHILITNLYKEQPLKEDMLEAIRKGIKFIDGGTEDVEEATKKRIYSFKKDGNYIFSGINQTHHIDLSDKVNLHWWVFLSLFMDMSSDCTFGELVYYRKRKNEGKLTKEEKANYNKIKKLVELEESNAKVSNEKSEFLNTWKKLNKK